MNLRTCWLAALGCSAIVVQAQGQGFLNCPVPTPPGPILLPPMPPCTLSAHLVEVQIEEQVARVQVRQTFRNSGAGVVEAEYFFPLPADSAVQDFVLTVDGREIPGRVLSRDEARRIYEDIVRRRRDPALLEYMGRGLFKTSVFPIAPGKESQVSLTYSAVLGREADLMTFTYPLGAARPSGQPAGELRITGQIRHSRAIKSVYSPSHSV